LPSFAALKTTLTENFANAWLLCERTTAGGQIPARNVRARCSLVAQWASGRAKLLSKKNDSDPNLINALYLAAGQASLLRQLAESQGSALSEPQLARLLEEALGRGDPQNRSESAAQAASFGQAKIRASARRTRIHGRLWSSLRPLLIPSMTGTMNLLNGPGSLTLNILIV
jgi:hypothetical protein